MRARKQLGVAEGVEVWLAKRWDMQLDDYPALSEEEQAAADVLTTALQKWSSSGRHGGAVHANTTA